MIIGIGSILFFKKLILSCRQSSLIYHKIIHHQHYKILPRSIPNNKTFWFFLDTQLLLRTQIYNMSIYIVIAMSIGYIQRRLKVQGWGLRSRRSVGALLKVLGFMVVTVGQAAFSCGYLSIIRHHRDGSSGGARRGEGA